MSVSDSNTSTAPAARSSSAPKPPVRQHRRQAEPTSRERVPCRVAERHSRAATCLAEGHLEQWLYVATLLATAGASALLIGPVPFHRILFRRGLKHQLVAGADLMARGGLALLALAINGAVLLILDVVVGGAVAIVLAATTAAWFVLIWYVVPLTARERGT